MIHNQNIIIFRTDAIKSDHACPSFSVCSIALFNHFVSIVLVRMELEGGVNPLTRTQQQFTAVESSHLQATIVNNKINQVAGGWGGGSFLQFLQPVYPFWPLTPNTNIGFFFAQLPLTGYFLLEFLRWSNSYSDMKPRSSCPIELLPSNWLLSYLCKQAVKQFTQ